MRIQFVATGGGVDEDDYSMVCGVEGRDSDGTEHALSFDRLTESASADDPADDWGVHLQYIDQSNGSYDRIKRCQLSRELLTVDLNGQLGRLIGVEGFDVDLAINDAIYADLRNYLRRIFRDMPGVLILCGLADFEADIADQRSQLDAWLDEAYAGEDARRYCGELDASYPGWGDIEKLVGSIFDRRLLQRLSPQAVDSIVFFISRNNEIGGIMAWLSTVHGAALSSCGHLAYDDFLFLCDAALSRPDDDCDYQLIACFRKLESLDEGALSRLERFFAKAYSYTRRMVLRTFEEFSLPRTVEAAKELWSTDECEFAKLDCLHSLKKFPEAKETFDEYLEQYRKQFDVDAEDYRRSHMARLTGERRTGTTHD